MRCTRCDRLAIPQATGLTPDGKWVFGWCVDCLEDTGCQQIEVAQPRRRRRKGLGPHTSTEPPHPLEDRRQVVRAISLVLLSWGVVLTFRGVMALRRPAALPTSPLGNGTAPMLFAGGLMCGLLAVGLWTSIPYEPEARRPGWRLAFRRLVAALTRRGTG